jgi:hypothetical protein
LWKKIKAEYIAGGTSYRKLAEKYEVKLSALRSVAEREKWVELKAQVQHKANTKIVDTVSDIEADRAAKIIDVADKLLDKISEVIDKVHDTKGIKNISSALKDIKEIKGIKSSADMREQEARIAKLQKDAEKVDDSDVTEIEVVFNAGEEEWNE